MTKFNVLLLAALLLSSVYLVRVSHESRRLFAAPKPNRMAALGRIKPGETELRANPRARSAVMRVAERTEVMA